MGFFSVLMWLVGVACAIWVIYDVVVNQKKYSNEKKLIWIICAVFFNIITAIVYYFLEKRK
ncbi:MAG: PLDc N-terminal domain-containing protein [Candidatus Nanoarchaeia archaeon]|nr:PLDc N-terminal domain-containing protein [Candidatus Nanoarchaeia archaeon]